MVLGLAHTKIPIKVKLKVFIDKDDKEDDASEEGGEEEIRTNSAREEEDGEEKSLTSPKRGQA